MGSEDAQNLLSSQSLAPGSSRRGMQSDLVHGSGRSPSEDEDASDEQDEDEEEEDEEDDDVQADEEPEDELVAVQHTRRQWDADHDMERAVDAQRVALGTSARAARVVRPVPISAPVSARSHSGVHRSARVRSGQSTPHIPVSGTNPGFRRVSPTQAPPPPPAHPPLHPRVSPPLPLSLSLPPSPLHARALEGQPPLLALRVIQAGYAASATPASHRSPRSVARAAARPPVHEEDPEDTDAAVDQLMAEGGGTGDESAALAVHDAAGDDQEDDGGVTPGI